MSMDVAIFSAKKFEKAVFDKWNLHYGFDLKYLEAHLDRESAPLAVGKKVVCAFVSDTLDAATLEILAAGGCRLIALRSAGFNHVDLEAAERWNLPVLRVPAYSPNAIAEHTVGLMLSLNRKIHKAYNRVREGNFSLEGLMGFDFSGRSVGVVGTGLIGAVVARIMLGFGCRVLASDPVVQSDLEALGVKYLPVDDLLQQSDIVTLHCPLTPETRHLIDARRLAMMKPGVMLINTGRGALIDTRAVINGLKSGHVGYLGLDVYEEEEGLFFEDGSEKIISDDVFARLLTFPNVLITGHQAFLTREALDSIVRTTLEGVRAFDRGEPLVNKVPSRR